MRQERVWGLSPGPHSRWDGASGYSRAVALGPIQDSMSCSVCIQRLYESQTHGVASHSSTNEGNPSCASTASKKQYMRDTLITSIHMRAPFNALIALSAEAQMPHARLPFPIKTCLYKVCAHQQHQALANPAHSKPNLLPQCSVGRD